MKSARSRRHWLSPTLVIVGFVPDALEPLDDEMAPVKAVGNATQRLAFPTVTEHQMSPENFRNRVFAAAVKRANENLAKEDKPPLPAGLTPHKLRHTFASVLVALGEDPGTVMDEMGHTDATFTLRVYLHGMGRDPASKARLQKLVGAVEWAAMGSSPHFEGQMAVSESNGGASKRTSEQGHSAMHPVRLELATSRSGGGRSIH
jgi:integrase